MKKLILSFRYAFEGLLHAFRKERNLKIHTVMAFFVIVAGIFFRLSLFEWCFIIFAIGAMMAAELFNTAIERTVDLVSEEYHPLAKQAKDIAAAACLIFAVAAALIGMFIFLPKIASIFL